VTPVSNQSLIDTIIEDWGNEPQSQICISIVSYLHRRLENPPSHITYGILRRIIGNNYNESDFLLAIQYLCGARVKLLKPRFELIEDEEVFELSNDEVKLAQETGLLIHPETGEQIKSFDSKVFMYFEPESLVELVAN